MNRIASCVAVCSLFGSSLVGCEAAIIRVQEAHRIGDSGTAAPIPGRDRVTFRPQIQRDLESQGCLSCHAGGTAPMQIRSGPGTDAEWRANYDAVVLRADQGASSPLLTKAMGADGHTMVFDAGSAAYARWEAWIGDGAPFSDTPEPPPPLPEDGGTGDGGTEPVEPPPGGSLTWIADIDPLLIRNGCRNCHGDRGGYSLETLEAAMASGSDDTPNVVPGDPSSLLIQYARDGHHGVDYRDALTILEWIVDWEARAE